MKKILFALLLLSITCATKAQETLSKSKSLIGIWNQVMPINGGNDSSGKTTVRFKNTGFYKIYNVDHTFLLFIANPQGGAGITVSGTYEEQENGEFIEHITHHTYNSKMVGTKSRLRYKIHNGELATIEYYNDALKTWVPEIWTRVVPAKIKGQSTENIL